jgi:hypothetical protein
MNKRHVALVCGSSSGNIGNAFIDLGGKWILEQIFPGKNIACVQSQPGYISANRKFGGNPSNDFELLRKLDVEWLVLQGPLLMRNFGALWSDTLEELFERGTKLLMLGIGFSKYTNQEVDSVSKIIERYQPSIVVTRDHVTFEKVGRMCKRVYSGIDNAFFVPFVHEPLSLRVDPFITLTFEKNIEPTITIDQTLPSEFEFDTLGHHFSMQTVARPGRLKKFFRNNGIPKRPEHIGSFRVVRPNHTYNPYNRSIIYANPGAIVSDEPFTYLTIYGNTELTLTDRVHACVATLAYGKPAMLFSRTPRAANLARLGLDDIQSRPVTLDPEVLKREQSSELQFLHSAINEISS